MIIHTKPIQKLDLKYEGGNVLFLLIAAILLFGALSFSVSSSARGSHDNVSNELASIHAGEVLEYMNILRFGAIQVTTNGYGISSVRADLPGSADYSNISYEEQNIFHPEGGEVGYRFITEFSAIVDVGNADFLLKSDDIYEIGSNADDLYVTLSGLSAKACSKINESVLGSDFIPSVSGAYNDPASALFSAGEYNSLNTTGAICLEDTNGVHAFYATLLEG